MNGHDPEILNGPGKTCLHLSDLLSSATRISLSSDCSFSMVISYVLHFCTLIEAEICTHLGSFYLSWLSSFQIPLTCAGLHTLTHGLERLSFPHQLSSFMSHSLYLCVEMMIPSQGTTKNNSVELRGAPVVGEPVGNWGTSSAFFPVTPIGLQSISLTWPVCLPGEGMYQGSISSP